MSCASDSFRHLTQSVSAGLARNTVLNAAVASALALLAATPWAAETTPTVNLVGRPLPAIDSLPDGPYRALVVQGHELSTRTFAVIGPEVKNTRKRFAGNNLACTSCHQADGAKPFAIPWVGVTATFPQYRGREDQISTVARPWPSLVAMPAPA